MIDEKQRGLDRASRADVEETDLSRIRDIDWPQKRRSLLNYVSKYHPQINRDTLRIARGLKVTSILMLALADDTLRPMGLSWSKLFVMLWLRAAQDEGVNGLAPSALSDCLAVTRNTMSTLLSGLERQEYITRAVDGDDKRRFVMQLTPAGAEASDRCAAAIFGQLDDVLSEVSADGRESLLTTLMQIEQLFDERLQRINQNELSTDA